MEKDSEHTAIALAAADPEWTAITTAFAGQEVPPPAR